MTVALDCLAVHAKPDAALGGVEAAHLAAELVEQLAAQGKPIQEQRRGGLGLAAKLNHVEKE